MRQGRRSRNSHFAIYVLDTLGEAARLGITVSRKVAPDAVTRNRIRRQIRESFRLHNDMPACDIVVMAQSSAARASNSELRVSLEDCWQRIRKS